MNKYVLSICLLIALPIAIVPARLNASEPLSLLEVVETTLRNNFTFLRASVDPAIAENALIDAQSAFDVEIFAGTNWSETERARTFSQTSGTAFDSRNTYAGARKRLDLGTIITAQTQLNRSSSNAGVALTQLSHEADLTLQVRQPLLRGFGRETNRADMDIAQARLDATIESLRDTLYRVLGQAESAYWNVARNEAQFRLSESNLQVAEAILDEAVERERIGVGTRLEVLQAQAARAQRVEELITTRKQLEDALDDLFANMGRTPDWDPDLIGQRQWVEPLPASSIALPDFRALWDRALATDPVLSAQEAVISQNEISAAVAANRVRPNLDLVLGGTYSGLDDRHADTAFGNALDREGHSWSVGLEFSMPWGRRGERAALRTANLQVEREELRYEELRQNLYRETRARYRELDTVQKSLAAAQLTVELQEASFEQETRKFEQGLSTLRDVQQAQRDLDQARIRLLQAQFQQLQAEIELARLSGNLLQRYGIPTDILPTP